MARQTIYDFDPNVANQDKPWGTFVPGRSPNWRVHKNRGHALNAISNHRHSGGAVWELVKDQWECRSRLDGYAVTSHMNCQGCGASPTSNYTTHRWQFVKDASGKIATPLVAELLCSQCR